MRAAARPGVPRAFLAAWALLLAASAADAKRPNVLLLVAEDLSPRIGAFGDAVAVTPSLDALARQGTRYDHVFTAAGVCAPSRAALVTGMHPASIGAQHMRTSSRPDGAYETVPPPHVKAFPELLRAAGYYTFTGRKLDYQFSGTLAGSGPSTIWDAAGGGTHWRDRPDAEQPFFGMINFLVTHESGVMAPLGRGWPKSLVHLGVQLWRAWQFGVPPEGEPVRPDDVVLPPYWPDTAVVRRDLARHYNNIAIMDAQVGELLRELEADGLADSTVVIWTTDHGDGLPRAKRDLYDSGIRVPMIVRWPDALRPPGSAPGAVDSRLVSFVDLAPTILGIAGVEAPAHLHGRDFTRADVAPREYVYASRDRIDEVADRERAVRDRRWKYIRSWHPDLPNGHPLDWRDDLDVMQELWTRLEAGELDAAARRWFEPTGEERLFDTHADPHETQDLSADPAHAETLERMRAAYAEWRARVGDTSEEDESRMVERMWPGGEQPTTAPPEAAFAGSRVSLTSETEGASIAYRIGSGPWRVYGGPVPVEPGTRLDARAVRYGFRESAEVSLTAP